MLRTYRALLRGDRIEWIERPGVPTHAVPVHVTLLEDETAEPLSSRGPAMAAALEALADDASLASIADPSGWQLEQRRAAEPAIGAAQGKFYQTTAEDFETGVAPRRPVCMEPGEPIAAIED